MGAERFEKVIVVGLDGLEPAIAGELMEAGRLPNLARVSDAGGHGKIATTCPAQTPVAWSTFATGTNPGGHGIFDFIGRDPGTYLPDLALNRYEQKNPFLPPQAVNLRRGTPFWEHLSDAGIASHVLRCPCTYPPDEIRGRMLSGMGVPDIRGGLGTATFYTSDAGVEAGENERVVHVEPDPDGRIETRLLGPRHPKSGDDVTVDLRIDVDPGSGRAVVRSDGDPGVLELAEGRWSEWLRVKFKTGLLQSTSGLVRFLLVDGDPGFGLYASPVNFDPWAPRHPISSPWDFAGELASDLGIYYTTGMVEEHSGLNNGRLDEEHFLAQCDEVLEERARMMVHELERMDDGFCYCLFDTPDRVQHMFWRFREEDHPAHGDGFDSRWIDVIGEHYERCDEIVGRILEYVDDRTLFIVLSDHGFTSFQRGFNVNTWLHEQGLLALEDGVSPGDETGEFFHGVDWSRTKAYSLGFGSIYLNRRGREGEGIVSDDEAPDVEEAIASGLTGLVDPGRGVPAIRGVTRRDEAYSGPYAAEAPELVVRFARGYRVSSETALGGIPEATFEDNAKPWSGDHIVDPELVPGALFVNRPFAGGGGPAVPGVAATLADMAPTILESLGVTPGDPMEGESILR